jgi:hypothetical protein
MGFLQVQAQFMFHLERALIIGEMMLNLTSVQGVAFHCSEFALLLSKIITFIYFFYLF